MAFKYSLIRFVKDWLLVICILAGVLIYVAYHSMDFLHPAGPVLLAICKKTQPILLFSMLFLSFCKIEPHQMRPHKWHFRVLFLQGGLFFCFSLLIIWAMRNEGAFAEFILANRIPVEAFMLCIITPTATAAAVVTGKLGGNMAGVVTYTVLINILVAIAVPLMVPLLYPSGETTFIEAFERILAKVFPLLIMPCLTAWIIRYLFPKLHSWFVNYTGLSFYIWAASLTLAIIMSTRAIFNHDGSIFVLFEIAIASLISCIFQFWAGKRIGSHSGCTISAGQSLGQKNTVFAIWLGYTFFNPIISVCGGFYSIWHNCFNTWQLYKRRKELEK